jgi:hypothetical protein
MRVVEKLPAVAEDLPPCSIRRNCRWWQQEGKAACQRCPQIITDTTWKVRAIAGRKIKNWSRLFK